jgi:sarcosine oxidase
MPQDLTRRDWAISSIALAQNRRSPQSFLVVGAGVIGAWTAYQLLRAGHKVTLIDQYGPANSRASSGGESRIIRARYGTDLLHTRSALRALKLWTDFFNQVQKPHLFQKVGALWMARDNDPRLHQHIQTMRQCGAQVEELSTANLRRRYPQIQIDSNVSAIFEPNAGGLMARQAVQAVVAQFVKEGGTYRHAQVQTPQSPGPLNYLQTHDGERLIAHTYLFACGPWLKTLLPDVLGERIFPTRQVVFFFGPSPGDKRFEAPLMPAWGDAFSEVPWYGLPDLESRGFKVAFGWLGRDFDPDRDPRSPEQSEITSVRNYVAQRFPALANAPIVETRVCQYENTANTDFVIDRHPAHPNLWFAGGGSGHAFKHGPAIGEYTAARLLQLDQPSVEPRYSLQSKLTRLDSRTKQRP